jgi:hypothetical protein
MKNATALAVASFYKLLGKIEGKLVGSRCPDDSSREFCERLFAFSQDEMAVLAPPTIAVLEKYDVLADFRYAEELTLVTALYMVHDAKMSAMKRYFEARLPGPSPSLTNGHAGAETARH